MKGETNYLADRISKHPNQIKDCPEFEGHNLSVCNKSRQLMEADIEVSDPMLENIAKEALQDQDYQYMISAIKNLTSSALA